MAEGAVLPVETMTGPVTGRSLWAEARGRLIRNRAALTSLIVLSLIALACIFGPFFTGHPFDRVYPDYVKVPASLEAYPKADQIEPNIERIGARVRAKAENIAIDNDVVRMTLVSSSSRPIDERLLAYFERSDLFGPAKIVEKQQDGQRLVVDVPLKRQYFFFGTDTNGRDLLTRSRSPSACSPPSWRSSSG